MDWDWFGRFAYETEAARDDARDVVVQAAVDHGFTGNTSTHNGVAYGGPGAVDITWNGPDVDNIERPAFTWSYNVGTDGSVVDDLWPTIQEQVADPSLSGNGGDYEPHHA